MDVREKLVELLLQEDDVCNPNECKDCGANGSCYYHRTADKMIAHGVTVQEWISVSERLPEEDIRVLVFTKEYIYGLGKMDTDRLHNNRWVRWNGCVTHWMPLPQPPKGE